ncbi:uncharacterized protein LOC107365581 [Tetranychus urticae]|uniref:Lipid-binding serum glycoprotein N-terminal domain-containing protein n=1 Tax=Tetranychus urticae TaxID=32264 RepID=T1KML8_TETUR|nr:uncharacterized protein LOC107365581 [Tetranychus urticae]
MITFKFILLLVLITCVHPFFAKRQYKINRRFEDSSYKGNLFSSSNRINVLKFYPPKYSASTPNNGASNASLEETFEEHLYNSLGDQLRANLKTGLSDLDIPSVDPYRVDKIHFEPLISGDPFVIYLKNFRLTGLSNFMVRELSSKLSELRFKIGLLFPKLEAECQYAVNGTLYSVLDVHGSGIGTLEYTDVLVRTTVNLDLTNGTLSLSSADPPFVDFSKSTISLKSVDGRMNLPSNSISGEVGPVLFWMLADELVQSLQPHASAYINSVVKKFSVPSKFKPAVTWLVKRNSPSSANFLFTRFSPISLLSNVIHAISSVKHGINLPIVIENIRNIRSNFRTNWNRLV